MPEASILVTVFAGSGIVAGIMSGLLGVGGGIVLVPAFYYAFTALGYPPDQLMQICVATSTGTIIFTSLRSVTSHHKRGAVNIALIKQWGPFIAMGSVVGVFAAATLRSHELQLIFGCIGILLGLYMFLGSLDWRISSQLPDRTLSIVYSLIIGFFSTLMGIGGGSLTVPLLSVYGIPPHKAVGASPGFGLMISVPAFFTFLLNGWDITGKPPFTIGYVNLPAVFLIVLTSMGTVPIGVRMAMRCLPSNYAPFLR